MKKLIFEYAVMNAGKTAKLLQLNFDHKRIGQKTLLLKPDIDIRDKGVIKSRNGFEEKCLSFDKEENLLELIEKSNVDIVFVDEAQFLTTKQVLELRYVVNVLEKNVICFGLKNDFMGKLFEGSKALIENADVLNENYTLCNCGTKATMIIKFNSENGKVIKSGEQVDCGAEDKYISVCSKHWYVDNIKEIKKYDK